MAAWRASVTMTRFIVVFLHFYYVLGMKVSITGSSHVCVSGSQVVHVNFGAGPIQQCGLLNTTPQASKQEGREDKSKGSGHPQGLYPCENERIHSLRVLRLDMWRILSITQQIHDIWTENFANKKLKPRPVSRENHVRIFFTITTVSKGCHLWKLSKFWNIPISAREYCCLPFDYECPLPNFSRVR